MTKKINISKTIQNIKKNIENPQKSQLKQKIQAHLNDLTKPPGSLGKMEDIALQYCLCRKNSSAVIKTAEMFVFAGDHGITEEGVSPYPKEVTSQMVLNMLNNSAAISVLCKNSGIKCRIIDIGVDYDFNDNPRLIKKKVKKGTDNFLRGPAMTEEELEKAFLAGYQLGFNCTADITGIGEMGIGNTSSSSALYSLLLEEEPYNTVGSGTGAQGELLTHKKKVIKQAVENHRKEWDGTPIDALRRVGGFEIAGMSGFIFGSANRNVPVVIDGFIASVSALISLKMLPEIKDYLYFAHQSEEQYHKTLLKLLKIEPILNLHMRLGEGTGAALAINIIQQALNCYSEMATFSSANVSNI